MGVCPSSRSCLRRRSSLTAAVLLVPPGSGCQRSSPSTLSWIPAGTAAPPRPERRSRRQARPDVRNGRVPVRMGRARATDGKGRSRVVGPAHALAKAQPVRGEDSLTVNPRSEANEQPLGIDRHLSEVPPCLKGAGPQPLRLHAGLRSAIERIRPLGRGNDRPRRAGTRQEEHAHDKHRPRTRHPPPQPLYGSPPALIRCRSGFDRNGARTIRPDHPGVKTLKGAGLRWAGSTSAPRSRLSRRSEAQPTRRQRVSKRPNSGQVHVPDKDIASPPKAT
jgi:hypothetical protein